MCSPRPQRFSLQGNADLKPQFLVEEPHLSEPQAAHQVSVYEARDRFHVELGIAYMVLTLQQNDRGEATLC